MIRPRTLILSPLLAVGGVGAILIGAAFYYGGASQTPEYEEIYAPVPIFAAPEIPPDVLTVAEFPRFFSGSFMWDGDSIEDQQIVALDVEDLNEVGPLIVATGRGTYNTTYRNIDFTFRIEANPTTGEFTMWESNPNVASGFVTEGRHVATFVDDLDEVSARWIGDDGQFGRLTLRPTTASARVGSLDMKQHPTVLDSAFVDGVRLEKRFVGPGDDCVTSDNDQVRVHYKGWNESGVFDDSWERGTPATFRPSQVIPGWTVALHQMCVGDYARVWIPAAMAYGPQGRGGVAAGDLVFEIEVLGVTH